MRFSSEPNKKNVSKVIRVRNIRKQKDVDMVSTRLKQKVQGFRNIILALSTTCWPHPFMLAISSIGKRKW